MKSNTLKYRLDRTLWELIYKQAFEYWPYYLGALICLFATHWIQSYLPAMAKELAELVEKSTGEFNTSTFVYLAIGIIIFRTSSRLLFFYPARVMQRDLRVELLDRLEKVSPLRYFSFNDGQLFQILQMDMEQLRALIGFALLQVGNIVVALIVLVPKLMGHNASLVYALSPLFIAFALFTIIVSRNRVYYRKMQDLQGEVQNIIIETYAGKKTIKNFHSEESFVDWFKTYSWKELSNFYRAGLGIGISIPLLPLGIGISLLWGAHIIHSQGLGASTLILFSGFVFLFIEPMMFLSWIGVVISRTIGSWKRIKELVEALNVESLAEKDLMQLNYHADKNSPVTFPFWEQFLDLDIRANRWSVFIGKTGVGKSHALTQLATVLKMRGENISYVSQHPYLYNDTVLGNIFLGQEYGEEEKKTALDMLLLFGLDYLTETHEALLNLEVGENGKHLSGGQAKRLCLVRSLMSGADILLWDDPFSSVDLILERQITDALKSHPLMQNKTILLSSHRITTVKSCDHVIFLDKEKGILESGSPEDLLTPEKETYGYFENQMV